MKQYRLADIIDIKHGFAFDGEHITQEDNGIVLVTPGNFKIGGGFQEEKCKFFNGEIPSEYILKPGSYIVTMTDLSKGIDTLEYSAIVPATARIYLHNQRIGLLRFKNSECDPHYIYYLMQTHSYQREIANTSTGATVHHTSPSKICDYKFFAPNIERQRKIATTLSAYDELLENNQKQIKLLEEAAQRLYKEWFVDLHFPGHENVAVVDGVPEGWHWCKLEDAVDFDPKIKLDKNRTKQSVPMSALSTTSMVLDHNEFVETESNSGSKFQNGDTLLARITPCLENGKTAFVWGIESDEGAVGSTEYIVMRSRTLNPYIVYLLARTDDFRRIAINSMSGSDGRQRVKSDKLKSIDYLHPSSSLIMRFTSIAQPLFERIFALNHQCKMVAQARDRLLPKLISGELEV